MQAEHPICLLISVVCLLNTPVFRRPGGDLLSHALRRSTIGAEGLHGRVRDGIGCVPLAITTKSSKRTSFNLFASLTVFTLPAISGKYFSGKYFANLPAKFVRAVWVDPYAQKDFKPIERLVLVSFTRYRASTPSLSTWWSSTALRET